MKHLIYIGEAYSILQAHISSDSISMVFAGVPFWSRCHRGCAGELGGYSTKKEFINELRPILEQCIRVTQPDGRMLLQAGRIFTSKEVVNLSAEFYNLAIRLGVIYKGSIYFYNTYKKNQRVFLGSYPYPCSIPIPTIMNEVLVFAKSGHREVANQTKLESVITKEQFKDFTNPVWVFSEPIVDGSVPLELVKRLIQCYSYKEDTVLDPFLGTGTTTLASIETGRNSVGIEINKESVNTIKRKLHEHISTITIN